MERDTRRALLLSLIRWDRPLSDVQSELKGFTWDWGEAPLVTLSAADVIAVLERLQSGEVEAAGVEEWADLLEGREDVHFDPATADVVVAAIYDLANPLLQGELQDVCRGLMERLRAAQDLSAQHQASQHGLRVLDDPTSFIRQHFDMFAGAPPRESDLIQRLIDEAVLSGTAALCARKVSSWWCVSSDVDWVTDEDGPGSRRFSRLSPFPRKGVNECHAEIVVVALSSAVVTSAAGDVNWIKGEELAASMPELVAQALQDGEHARVIAFLLDASIGWQRG